MKRMRSFFIPVFITMLFPGCSGEKRQALPAAGELTLEWSFPGNTASGHRQVLTLRNNSVYSLGNTGWALYFNQQPARRIGPGSVSGGVSIVHLNGNLFRIAPGKDFSLPPGESVEIGYEAQGRLIKKNEAPQGPYMVYTDSAGMELAVRPVERYVIRPFPPLEKVFLPAWGIELPTAAWNFRRNEEFSMLPPGETSTIIPAPMEMETGNDSIELGRDLVVHYARGLKNEAETLAGMLSSLTGRKIETVRSSEPGHGIILLRTGFPGIGERDSECYMMESVSGPGVTITGTGPAGVFYGIQSLLAMIPVRYFSTPSPVIRLATFRITDGPAFPYRGMHLDVARNFNGPDAIKKLIRIIGFYKLNKLHLHLTDDEGWRIEIRPLPELTEVGGFRGHTEDEHDRLAPAYGSGPDPDPEKSWGSGFLTREEFIDILEFAGRHHVEVIPEINMPGHARAAIIAMENRYRRLMKDGKTREAERYRLIDPDDSSHYRSAQNYDDNIVCVCKEAPYEFYKAVVDELIAMYAEAGLRLRTIHTGGDEVPRGAWEGSPVCRAFLEAHPELGPAARLQSYFTGRIAGMLEAKGIVAGGWEEIAMDRQEGGVWSPAADLAGGRVLPYVWNSRGRNLDLGYRLANAGFPVVLCNVGNYYFDLAYTAHPDEPGLYWGGFVDTRKAFEFSPFDLFQSEFTGGNDLPAETPSRFAGMVRLRPDATGNIIGLQGQLWSETIKGPVMLEYYYLPKMLGLAERAWSGEPDWATLEDPGARRQALEADMNRFFNRIGRVEMPRLDYIFGGFNYRLPPPGALIRDGILHANSGFPGLIIRYTTNGTEPVATSSRYEDPVVVSDTVKLKCFDTRGRGSRTSEVAPE